MSHSSPPSGPLTDFTIFFGDANPAEARLYVRFDAAEDTAAWTLRGSVVGPQCHYARTLTSTIPLLSLSGPDRGLAQAILPDPCFWSPREPYLYQVRVELQRAGRSVTEFEHPFGIRRLGVAGPRLILDGKNWIVRGVRATSVEHVDLSAFHDSATALVIDEPDDEFCAAAGHLGVLLIAQVGGRKEYLVSTLRRLARWTAVGMVILDSATTLPPEIRELVPNLLLVSTGDPKTLPPWADLALSGEPFVEPATHVPRLAARWILPQSGVAEARTYCDRLQRDLAEQQDLVGYLV